MPYLGAFAAFAASVTWAFASARYAEASRSAGGTKVNLVRALVAASLWLGACLVSLGPDGLRSIGTQRALYLAASIACSYAIGDNVFFAAARRIGISSALAIATIYPLWAALYGALVRAEPFGALRALGVGCCLGGITALLFQVDQGTTAPGPGRRRGALGGVALSLLTSLLWAGNAVFLKLGAEGLEVVQANALRFSVGALLLVLQTLVQAALRRETSGPAPVSLRRLAALLALPLLADTGLGSICYTYGIANTDLALGATLSSLSPLVSLPIAAAMGSERITPAKVAAVTITVTGIVLLVLHAAA